MSQITTETDTDLESAILVGVRLPGQTRHECEETLNELALLADTAGAEVVDRMVQERSRLDSATFIGRGKVDELAERIKELGANLVIFDDDLSPAQMKGLEEPLGVKIIDRSRLILDIFSRRAKTREAQTQVELAQLQYSLPRLTRQWTHLSRQSGGSIGLRGPGETQLEVDRRAIRTRINSLSSALNRISRQRTISRKSRKDIFQVALVGYTNAGKSTLMRTLSGADVFIEDRLFATLDSTTRSVDLGYNRSILLTDTVGFIRKLPHHLVASFRSTLEETIEADLLMHVVDVSHPAWQEHVSAVVETLNDLDIADAPTLMVMNKADRLEASGDRAEVQRHYEDAVWISALKSEGIEELKEALYNRLEGSRVVLNLQIPQASGKLLSELHRVGEVLSTRYSGNDVLLEIKLSRQNADRIVPDAFVRAS